MCDAISIGLRLWAQRNRDGAFIVWRITAKKRMVVKLKVIREDSPLWRMRARGI